VLEERLQASGVRHSIVRPTLLFGPNDVLVNNLAWFLRRVPLFGIFGRGRYRLQPVHVDDVARICVDDVGPLEESVAVDAAGPERYEFREFVRLIRDAVRSRALLLPMPPAVALAVSRLAGLALRDVVLTRDEVAALTSELLMSESATGTISFSAWVRDHGPELGRRYVNDLRRHFPDRRSPAAAVLPGT
jgi:NADH dehydrogenase